MDVIAEDLRTQIRVIAEGQTATNDRLDRLTEEMGAGFRELKDFVHLLRSNHEQRIRRLDERDRPSSL